MCDSKLASVMILPLNLRRVEDEECQKKVEAFLAALFDVRAGSDLSVYQLLYPDVWYSDCISPV